ncbi:MAG: hypothetical protein HYV08_18110 [Deltaproteobacteria bacterium]|nr:hypothetical protein [Deltaproteobacteria bacterium]MBI3079694.1 hypothetical protein [Deltaproteobacteria bacterium]
MRRMTLGALLKQTLENGSDDLVTRPTGARLRERIEEALADGGGPELVVLDFGDVGIIDYSCADEIVAKLASRLAAGEYGSKYVALAGLNRHQEENIEVALERKKLALLYLGGPEGWKLLGTLNAYLRETLHLVMGQEQLTARALAERLRLELNTASTRLINLHKLRLVARREEPVSNGGRQFVYRSLLKEA